MGKTMTDKHTPGPWEVHAEPINPLYRGIIGLGSESNQEKPWAVVAKIHIDRPAYDIMANARLIAAAPCLLAALETLTKRYVGLASSGDCGFWNPEEEDEVIAARAALSRAKGEQ